MIRFHRRIGVGVALVVVWCALWGSFSAANMLGGAAIALVLWTAGIARPSDGAIRIVPMAKLVGLVAVDLLQSTYGVAVAALRGPKVTDERIIVVDLPDEAQKHLLLIVTAVTLTPGTAVVQKQDVPCRLRLHLLNGDDAEQVEAHVHQLVELTAAAFGERSERPKEPTP